MSFKSIAFLALATGLATVSNAQASGSGTTTRYWDCCKPSCAWSGKALVSNPVQQCDKNNNPLAGGDSNQSACTGGNAYNCADQTAMVNPENPLQAFGFAAANVGGASEGDTCCACYELTFTSTSLQTSGKSMIVQVTNTGTDLVENQFDLAFPGGGVGIFNACTNEYGNFPLGAQYGGITDGSLCAQYPAALQAGCNFRFGWFEGADNPTVTYKEVTCPAALTDKTKCIRQGQTPTGPSGGSSTAATLSVTTAAASVVPSSSSIAGPASSSTTSSTTTASTLSTANAPSSAATSTSASKSSYSAPAQSSSSSTTTLTSVAAATSSTTTAAAATTTSVESNPAPNCPVQYVIEYDL
ncbi:hypothetical protein ANO11243_010910 [Dothideomycetidae sp. 11243]|nr:hypothetical protein ANO11243_010910 [fungal sp. No.11243]